MRLEVLKFQRRSSLLVLGTLLTGGAYFFSTGLTGLRPLVWVAPLPVLILAFNSSARASALMAFTAYFLGGLNLFSYLSGLAPASIVVFALSATAKSRWHVAHQSTECVAPSSKPLHGNDAL